MIIATISEIMIDYLDSVAVSVAGSILSSSYCQCGVFVHALPVICVPFLWVVWFPPIS